LHRFTLLTVVLAALVGALLTALPADAATTGVRVTRWIDGDTVVTTRGTVRLIGIDTPERGECGYAKATRHAQAIAGPGSRIRLVNPGSVMNRDRYGRSLRYVQTPGGRDVGLAQIKDGARARYDGRDGYQRHPKQTAYRTADAHHRSYRCGGAAPTGDLRSYPPVSTRDCPANAPLKGNRESMIYHAPGQAYYDATSPEECFASPAAAERAGYRAAKI
jgi:micrococcal nuclease